MTTIKDGDIIKVDDKKKMNEVIRLMVDDLWNHYIINARGSEDYVVRITPRKLNIIERFRVRRALRLRKKYKEIEQHD